MQNYEPYAWMIEQEIVDEPIDNTFEQHFDRFDRTITAAIRLKINWSAVVMWVGMLFVGVCASWYGYERALVNIDSQQKQLEQIRQQQIKTKTDEIGKLRREIDEKRAESEAEIRKLTYIIGSGKTTQNKSR